MSWPKLRYFGVVENPITFSPYVENSDEGSESPEGGFLLLQPGQFFLLLQGGNLLLL